MNCPLCRTPMADMADIADTPGFPGQVWECGSCRRRYTPDLKSQLSGAMKSEPILVPMKGCVFCGGVEVDFVRSPMADCDHVSCRSCGACGPRAEGQPSAVRLWNDRPLADLETVDVSGAVGRVRAASDENLFGLLLGVLEGLEWSGNFVGGKPGENPDCCPHCGAIHDRDYGLVMDHEPDCRLASALTRLRSHFSRST